MPQPSLSPFPVLYTQRLCLRELTMEDDKEIFELRSLPELNKYIERPLAISIEEAHAFIKKIEKGIQNNESLYWTITFKNEPRLVGTICLWNFSEDYTTAETGYELHPRFQGKGIMAEAMECVLAYCFGILQLSAIEAYTHHENLSSIKLLEKMGFDADRRNDDSIIYIRKR